MILGSTPWSRDEERAARYQALYRDEFLPRVTDMHPR
jgi:hypothetical protein